MEAEIGASIRRLPVIATLLVVAAVATMIGLGFWQLRRADEKAALLVQLRDNPSKPPVAFPTKGPVPDVILFRRSKVQCASVTRWSVEAGRAADGSTGYRLVVQCSGDRERAGPLIALGVTDKPDFRPRWNGGTVSGWITRAPDRRPLLAHLSGQEIVLPPLLIAASAPDGLRAVAPPKTEDIPNNHKGYAAQWFAFAGIALVIYGLAVARRRGSGSADS